MDIKKLTKIKRLRIAENRDLINGLRLNRNERVQDWENNIYNKIFSKLKKYQLGSYPDNSRIYQKISEFFNIDEETLLVTSGIDGAIKTIWEILTKPGTLIGLIGPSYAMYEVYSNIYDTNLEIIQYDPKSLKLDRKKLFKFLKKKPRILFLPNPNQPIEDNLTLKEISSLCEYAKKNGTYIVIDEAYYHFGIKSSLPLVKKHKNLIILRTFSKGFGVPSIRLGFLVSDSVNIEFLSKTRLAYESNLFTDEVAIYLMKNFKKVEKYINKVIEGREYTKKKLIELGLDVNGRKGNYLLVGFESKETASKLYNYLLKNKIYVKGNYKSPLENYILITCGPKNIMNILIKRIKFFLSKK